MVVACVVGLLAVLAVPVFHDSVVKGQMTEVFNTWRQLTLAEKMAEQDARAAGYAERFGMPADIGTPSFVRGWIRWCAVTTSPERMRSRS